MLPILHIGPLAIQTPGLILLLGLWIGISLTERQAHHHAIPAGKIYNLLLWPAAAGIVAARLSYIASHFSSFAESPGSIVSLNTALLDPWAGAAGAFLAALIYGHRSQLPFWNTLDALTHLLAVFAVASGLSHLASGDAYGAPADLPWSIWLWGANRHPSQIYEGKSAVFILFALLPRSELVRLYTSDAADVLVLWLVRGAVILCWLKACEKPIGARWTLEALCGRSVH